MKAKRPHPALIPAIAAAILALSIAVPILQGENYYTSVGRGYAGGLAVAGSTFFKSATWIAAVMALAKLGQSIFTAPASEFKKHGRPTKTTAKSPEPGLGWTLGWGLLSIFTLVFVAAESNDSPLKWVLSKSFFTFIQNSQSAQVWIVTLVCSVLASAALKFWRGWTSRFFAYALIISSMILVLTVSLVSVGAGHDFATDFGTFGMGGLLIWVSSAIGTYQRISSGGKLTPQGFGRMHLLMLFGALTAVFGFLPVTVIDLAGQPPFGSPFGTVAVIFLIVGALAVAHSWRLHVTFSRSTAQRTTSPAGYRFQITAAGVLAGAALALYLGMNRTVPPRFTIPQTTQENYLGFSINGHATLLQWLLPGRPSVLFILLPLIAIALNIAGLVVLHRRGDKWPAGRTVAWILGWVAVYYMTSSVWGERSPGSFGLHMIGHMGLNMLAPVLLVMGGPLTLILRAVHPAKSTELSGPREWVNAAMHSRVVTLLSNPLLVFAIFVGSYYALYFSPLFALGMRYHWAHQLMNIHFILAGYLFYWLVLGVDRSPRPMPYIGKLGFTLAAMPFHAFFAVAIMSSTEIIAENFYRTLAPDWNLDLKADQYLGGGVAWAAGELPLIVVVIALLIQWSRSDNREAKRQDRKLLSGRDESLDSYNEMLAQLAGRTTSRITTADSSPGAGGIGEQPADFSAVPSQSGARRDHE